MTDRYVVGFAFTQTKSNVDVPRVLLCTKRRPHWQVGALNGIGGKVEEHEDFWQAMHREGIEEAGLDLRWEEKAVLRGRNSPAGADGVFECRVFVAFSKDVWNFQSRTDEVLMLYDIGSILRMDQSIVTNCLYLIPYLYLDREAKNMTVNY